MRITIKRVDNSLPLPEYQTNGSVGFDLICRQETVIQPGKIELLTSNIILNVPKGYMLSLFNRSSSPIKKGLILANGVGVVDQDYCGPNDEIKIQMYNFTNEPVLVPRGDRIAQGIIIPIVKVSFSEIDIINENDRGGHGSTG